MCPSPGLPTSPRRPTSPQTEDRVQVTLPGGAKLARPIPDNAGAGQNLISTASAGANGWVALVVMPLSVFMVFVDGTVMQTALPPISRDSQTPTPIRSKASQSPSS